MTCQWKALCASAAAVWLVAAMISFTGSFTGCNSEQASSSEEPEPAAETAAEQAAAEEKPATAKGVLDAMVAAYQKASSYADAGTVRLVAQVDERNIDERAPFSVTVVRPNKVRLEVYRVRAVSDGKQLHAAILDLPDQVLIKPVADELTMHWLLADQILGGALTQGFAGPPPQLGLLIDEKALQRMLFDAESTTLDKPGEIEGHECFRVRIQRPYGTDVLWIDQQTFVLRRVTYAVDELRRMLSREGTVKSISLAADFTGARFNEQVTATAFAFETPAGAEIVKFFVPPHPGQLLGKPVPEFEFVDLAENPVTRESLAGKVAVLDFWATWCLPCRQSLPNLSKVYQQYTGDDRVAMLAVSVDQAKTENQKLLDTFAELKVQLPIVRDLKQNAGALFNSANIPVMFLVDAKGVVQDYEVGANPNLAAELPEKITRLLAGEDIYQQPLEEYRQMLKEYEEALAKAEKEPPAQSETPPSQGEDVPIPRARIAERSQPKSFRLAPLWKCTELRAPGNMLVVRRAAGPPLILVVDIWKSIAEVGPDGKLLANHVPQIGQGEFINALRTAVDGNGKRYFVAFSLTGGQQRCHVFDEAFKLLVSYPADALENRHSGIADVAFGDLDGDGTPELGVGYFGLVGVQAASMEGKRLWSNRSIANVMRIALTNPDAQGRRSLVCANPAGPLAIVDYRGQTLGQVTVPGRPLERIVAADLEGDGQLEWCGLSAVAVGKYEALGLDLDGKELWNHPLPAGVHEQPVERIIAGRLTPSGPGQWLLPGCDGSIHVVGADGTLLDQFNYGATLAGLATAIIDGQAVLLVSSPNGLEAWKIE